MNTAPTHSQQYGQHTPLLGYAKTTPPSSVAVQDLPGDNGRDEARYRNTDLSLHDGRASWPYYLIATAAGSAAVHECAAPTLTAHNHNLN